MSKQVEVMTVQAQREALTTEARKKKWFILSRAAAGAVSVASVYVCASSQEVQTALTSRGPAGITAGIYLGASVAIKGVINSDRAVKSFHDYKDIYNELQSLPNEKSAVLDPQDLFHGEGFIVPQQEN